MKGNLMKFVHGGDIYTAKEKGFDEILDFSAAIRENQTPKVRPDESLRNLRTLDRLHAALKAWRRRSGIYVQEKAVKLAHKIKMK